MTDLGATLFDPRVAFESVAFDPCDASRFADVALPAELARAVLERQVEFRAGRACASRALARTGWSGAPIGRGPEGAPAWPPGVVGAITHASGFAAAAVARASDFAGVGLDVEPVVSASALREVAGEIAGPGELDRLASAALDERTLVTLVFSAKESVYKCARAAVGRWFGFDEATVTRVADGTFDVAVDPLARTLTGRFVIAGDLVHTSVVLSPTRRA